MSSANTLRRAANTPGRRDTDDPCDVFEAPSVEIAS